MPRVTVYHLTPPRRLPLIEEEGLRTRADMSGLLGPIDDFDRAAPGRYAHGKRVSGFVSLDHAKSTHEEFGAGLVSYTVDPAKTLANRASERAGDAAAYWSSARPLAAWQADGELPDDLEVHVNTPIRNKYLSLHAPLFGDDALGDFAPLVARFADDDRLSAKALMHLAIITADGDFDSPAFNAACALAWRDTEDEGDLIGELIQVDPDSVAAAALTEAEDDAPEAVAALRETLDETRQWAEENGTTPARALFMRTAMVLEEVGSAEG